MTKAEAIARVRKLSARTAAAGSTANEVRIAGEEATRLIKEHGLTPHDISEQTEAAPRPTGRDPMADFVQSIFRAAGIEFTVTDDGNAERPADLDDLLGIFDSFFGNAPSSSVRKGKVATDQVRADHARYPNRVHMAVNNMRSVCGIGPTFVWTTERKVAIASGIPCPHCMETGILDARTPTRRLPRHKLRDSRGRWIAG